MIARLERFAAAFAWIRFWGRLTWTATLAEAWTASESPLSSRPLERRCGCCGGLAP